jgi:hypothetical protein
MHAVCAMVFISTAVSMKPGELRANSTDINFAEKDGGPLRISSPLPEGQKSKRPSRQEGLALVGRL